MATPRYDRGVGSQTVAQMPYKFDIITKDSGTVTGNWVCLQCYNVDSTCFPNDETSIIFGEGLDAEGINLSAMNSVLPNGDRLNGCFTQITLGPATTARIIAYRY